MGRLLTIQEIKLIQNLLSSNRILLNKFNNSKSAYKVQEQDGGMGSLTFILESNKKRKLGKTIAESEFKDSRWSTCYCFS